MSNTSVFYLPVFMAQNETYLPELVALLETEVTPGMMNYMCDLIEFIVDSALANKKSHCGGPTLRAYAKHIHAANIVSMSMYLTALSYIDRSDISGLEITDTTEAELLLGSFIIASKYTQEPSFSIHAWRIYAGVEDVRILAHVERAFLELSGWAFALTQKDLLEHRLDLLEIPADQPFNTGPPPSTASLVASELDLPMGPSFAPRTGCRKPRFDTKKGGHARGKKGSKSHGKVTERVQSTVNRAAQRSRAVQKVFRQGTRRSERIMKRKEQVVQS